jgi:hypothetical protein
MLAFAAFVSSVLISTNVLKGRDSNINSNLTDPKQVDTDKEIDTDTTFRDNCCLSMHEVSNLKNGNKKRKQPLSSRETRVQGELEAAETAFTSAVTALRTLSQVSDQSYCWLCFSHKLLLFKKRIGCSEHVIFYSIIQKLHIN